MGKLAIWAQLEAKPGKEQEVEKFLKSAQPLAEREPGTITWYAIKMGPGKYGIFDTFADDADRLRKFLFRALQEGLYIVPDGRFYTSAVHTERELDETLNALDRAFALAEN